MTRCRALAMGLVSMALLACGRSSPNSDDTIGVSQQGLSTKGSSAPPADDAAALKDLARLRGDATEFTELRFEEGLPVFMSLRVGVAGNNPVERALAFIDSYRALFRLEDAKSTLFPKRIVEDGRATHVFFGQRRGDAQVLGADLAVHLEGDEVTGTNGRYLPEPWSAPSARISGDEALGSVLASKLVLQARSLVSPELLYFDTRLLGMTSKDKKQCGGACPPATLTAWRILVSGNIPQGRKDVTASLFVDAVSGKILRGLDHALYDHFALDVRTFDTDLEPPSGVMCPRGPSLSPGDEPQVLDVAREAGRVVDFFHNRFGIHSWDGSGAMDVLLNATSRRAHYDPRCNRLNFEDGYVVTDVFGHEFTHGVHVRLGAEPARDETRAIAEHVSDVFGAVVEGENWLMGETTPGGTRRNMQDPAALGDPDHYRDYDDPFDDWFDFQEVIHKNAGIGNKAAYLMTDGGTHHGVTVSGALGREKLARLYYPLVTERLTASSTYPDLRDLAVDQARDLARVGRYGFVRADVCTVNDAFAAVGLGRPCGDPGVDADGDDIPDDIDTCPGLPDPLQRDFDGDGEGDLCEDDLDGDTVRDDGDGSGSISDNRCRGTSEDCDDNCPLVRNLDQADADGDGRGDACDDRDGDTIVDARDNCPDTPNVDQANFDGDAFDGDPTRGGDVCDRDADGDDILDSGFSDRCTGGASTNCNDNCVVLYDRARSINADQQDTDGDGVGNACDNCEGTATLNIRDTDGDLVGDDCDADADNDGVCNFFPDPPEGTPGGACSRPGRSASSTDNCPLVPNPEQFDFDHDNVGTLCDFDEEQLLSGEFGNRWTSVIFGPALFDGIFIPLDPCPNDFCVDFPRPDSLVQLEARAGKIPLEISVVDRHGFRIAGPVSGKSLEFSPKAAAYFLSGSGAKPFRGDHYALAVRTHSPPKTLPEKLSFDFRIGLHRSGAKSTK